MASSRPVRMLCTYRVKRGKCGKRGGAYLVETFSWADAGAASAAHEASEVMSVRGPMEALVEDMEFAEVETVPMRFGTVPGPRPTRPAPPRRRRPRRPRPSAG